MIKLTNQKGVALITALMIVALASVVSISISTKLQLDIRRTGNILASDQAKLYTFAAEELAMRYLADDIKNNQIDDLSEPWAQPYIFPIEGGTLQAELTDLQACINLNALVRQNNYYAPVRRHLEQLFLNAQLPVQLSQAIKDWIDTDQDTTIPDGAEDGYYTGLETPYRNANTILHSISELKLIKGFKSQDTIDLISKNVCAYNTDVTTLQINVNTAPAEVLLSLSSGMNNDTAECIIDTRATPYTSANNFMTFCNLNAITPPIQTAELSVNTRFFMLETNIIIGKAKARMFSIIQRSTTGGGVIRVISRSQSVF